MSKEELFKKYQEIVLKTNGGADDYVVALCQISNLIKEFAEEKDQQIADLEAKLAENKKQCQECKHLNKKIELNIKNKLMAENCELQKQLAESEKNFIIANNLRKNSDEVLLNYKTKKYGLDKTIEELRKMKLSLPEKEWYYKGFENCERQMSSHIADLTLEVKQLKQQLHDLLKKIVGEIRDCLLDFSNGWWRYFMTDGCEYMLSSDLQGCLDEIIDTILKKYGGENE